MVALSPVKTSSALPEDFWNVDRPEDARESVLASPVRTEAEDPDFTLQKEKDQTEEAMETRQEDEKMETPGQGCIYI